MEQCEDYAVHTGEHAGGKDGPTYDGAPLYTFANDKKPGDIKGQGVISSWWAVVVPDV